MKAKTKKAEEITEAERLISEARAVTDLRRRAGAAFAEAAAEELELLLKTAMFVVEASTFEKHTLWERCSQQATDSARTIDSRLDWNDDTRGWVIQIGNLDDRPVNICIFGSLLNGHRVLFYEAVSQVVDWVQIEEWFKHNCWPLWDSGRRRAHCKAMTFHDCCEAVAEAK